MDSYFNEPGQPRTLNEVLLSGYRFQWRSYISEGFRTFGDEFGIYVAFTLVYAAISLAGGSIPYIGSTIGLFVNPPLIAGFIFYGILQRRNDHRDFNAFFSGFRQPYWIPLVAQSLLSTLAIALVIGLVCVPLFYTTLVTFMHELEKVEGMPQDEIGNFVIGLMTPELYTAIIVAVLVGLFVSTFLCLAPCFIVLRRMNQIEAIRSSILLVSKKFLPFLALVFSLWMILIAGVMLCCIGLLAAFPIYYLTLLSAFEHIMGSDSQYHAAIGRQEQF